ncbi:hypothetical protein RJZ56_006040 [Blastomyces dermatitidis]|uniref:SH3 and Ded_cyto domain-containing protein n=2 Tax=Ajellomyces dermatitidis TaxID=5039 RepID=F2TQC6_AJEDA|nr:uncharacterized protein BDCG_07470 [Blastomyces dermatitidis ER-3]XP_045282163.1 hypothetical protein, variant [Blastomyces dermatitidis ER-3]EGE85439.1 SH3 and Ded_cyto domain-containing protein [Blastomyces dermatitidis ATCC 18188]EQL28255.1 hypothetical protein BDFG_08986 [Blastomyces dermatitidis ATCC 26199]EQL28256.1 hypothetical protein, variant [Blastomyces dermatitidis ATCC 26199]KMW68637.1 SH3 and Ded_cyto domain-containing protein, variant [Blastomyces dermatitidis ATCC 18188]OAT
MPWRPLPRIAFAVAIYPFKPSSPADLPLELGDELYIIEQGGTTGSWYRGYLVAPPSLLAGLTSVKGRTLEARVFSGIFPKNCVEVREVLGDADGSKDGRLSTQIITGKYAGSRTSTASPDSLSVTDGRTLSTGVGDLKASRKMSQITIIKLEEDVGIRRSASPSLPLTPISLGPRDPNTIKPPAPVPMLKIGDETPTSAAEPLVDEIASCLREWHSTNIHQLLLARQYTTLENMSNIVLELDLARRQLLHNVLTAQERAALREETVWNLVRGNKMLSGEVVVRDPNQRGRLLTGDDSAMELTKLQSEMSMLDSGLTPQLDNVSLHHLLFEVNAVSGTDAGSITLAVSLWLKQANGDIRQLSETYSLDLPTAETFATLVNNTKLKTLFTDLSAADIGEGSNSDSKLYLVIKALGSESPRVNAPPKSRSSSSRDGSLSNRVASGINSAGKGSLKTRRSMMWGPKSRGPGSEVGKELSRHPPQSSDSVTAKPSKADTSGKEAAVARVVGLGALDIGAILKQCKEVEQVVNIWSPRRKTDEEDDYSEGFDEIVRSLLYSATKQYVRSFRAGRVHVQLHPFTSEDAETLVRNNPTSLHNVTQTKRIGFPGAPTKPRSDIYVTLNRAIISQDALLSHPINCQVPVPQITGLRNLQLTLEVRNTAGARIEHCIYPSSNALGQTAWRTTVAERGAAWNQTIRLNIPADQVPGAHLIMSVADAPEFPFALSWMPLWDQQAFIRDGRHSLLLHAYDKSTSSIENGRGAYLSLPWSALGKNESTKDEAVTGPLATLSLETDLCSTEYSQDHVILGLISWREKSATEVLELLKRIVFVPEIEIVKQLRDVFDALFGIIVENAGNEEYEDLVFNDLVTVLGIVHDRRFNLGPLVDHYAENQFNFPFATPCLIRSYCRLLQATPDSQQSRSLRAAFKVGRHLLKFIINAREQQKAKEEGIGITKVQSTFNRDLHFIFKSVEALMQNPAPILVGSKTLVVQHFHTWLPELSSALTKEEIINIALSFMDSCKDVKSMLILYKLVLILNYIRLPLFESPKDREMLFSSCVDWLAPYWGQTDDANDQYRDQVRLCSSIVAEQLKYPSPEMYVYMPKAVASYCVLVADGVEETDWLSMLFSKSFPFQLKQSKTKQKFEESLVELAAVIASLATIPNPTPLSFKDDDLALFLSQALETHKSVLSCDAYPPTWLSLHIYHHRAIMKSLEYLSTMLISSFLPPPDDADNFDMELWKLFFETLLKLVSSDALTLETFPEQKRRAVWKIAGDVREHGADLLRRAWEAIGWESSSEEQERYGLKKLGGYQVQYVPSLVCPIIELCLSVHEGLRHVAVGILQTMIVSEWQLNEDLSFVEAEIISSLDLLFKTKNANESGTQKTFINELLDLFEIVSSDPDADLLVALKELVATVDELLDLLVASQNGNITESLNTLKLMEFMKDMDKEDIFIRYVHELARGQIAARNYTEAGLALQFHADLYDWDISKPVPALTNPVFPEQTSFERKEALYFEIIQHFEDGKAWAHALSCYRELAHYYEHTVLDFSKLSRTQASMAKIYDAIVKGNDPPQRYFRVTFKGLGFPATLRDKQYIFEGYPTDRMATFTDRMQKQYPAAQIVSSDVIDDLEGQFLQISAVSVQKDMNHAVYQRSKVPYSVREHLLTSVPSQFSITSKRHTSGDDVKEQWVVKTVFTTTEPFPNILRRSEIISSEEIVLTPLQTAIERTWRKTQELLLLERRASSGEDFNLTGLTEVLSRLLDLQSTSSGCVALYRQFLVDESKMDMNSVDCETEEQAPRPVNPLNNAMAVALIDHALAIKRCLALYNRPAYQATQLELSRHFEIAFAPEVASLSPVFNTPAGEEPPSLLNGRSDPLIASRPQPIAQTRPISPEQELIRATRQLENPSKTNKSHEKTISTHRISLNPFKRSNHSVTNSNSTINASTINDVRQQSESKLNGTYTSRPSTARTDATDAVSVTPSRAASRRSRNKNRDSGSKRRSWFGGGGGGIDTQKNSSSISAPATSTEDIRTTQQRITERARSSRSQDGRSGNIASHPPNAENSGNGGVTNGISSAAAKVSQLTRTVSGARRGTKGSSNNSTNPTSASADSNNNGRPVTSERLVTKAIMPTQTTTVTTGENDNNKNAVSNSHRATVSTSVTTGPTAAAPAPDGNASGVRDSMMKRFSMLKVGKKTTRHNVRDGGGVGGMLREE